MPENELTEKQISDATTIGKIIVDQGLAEQSQVRQSLSRWQEMEGASDDTLINNNQSPSIKKSGLHKPPQREACFTAPALKWTCLERCPGSRICSPGVKARGVFIDRKNLHQKTSLMRVFSGSFWIRFSGILEIPGLWSGSRPAQHADPDKKQ